MSYFGLLAGVESFSSIFQMYFSLHLTTRQVGVVQLVKVKERR
jgi:hypothetical protein